MEEEGREGCVLLMGVCCQSWSSCSSQSGSRLEIGEFLDGNPLVCSINLNLQMSRANEEMFSSCDALPQMTNTLLNHTLVGHRSLQISQSKLGEGRPFFPGYVLFRVAD